jgi:hypothetical protein
MYKDKIFNSGGGGIAAGIATLDRRIFVLKSKKI